MKLFQIISIIILSMIFTIIPSYGYTNSLYISVAPKMVEFHLVDPTGRISGYMPGGGLGEITFMADYVGGGVDSPDPITDPMQEWHMISSSVGYEAIMNGKYKLVLYGTTVPTTILIGINIGWSDSTQWVMRGGGKKVIWPNAVWTYEFDVPVTPTGTQLVLTRVSQPGDLANDIRSAASVGYIGNAKFVAELVKEINDIEAEKAKGKIDDGLTPAQKAKKEYTELLKEITEKYNKPESDEFVRQDAYTVLKEDIEYIINHL